MKRIFNGSGGRKTALILSLCLIFALAVGTTFALLKANTAPVENTFTAAKSGTDIVEKLDGSQKTSIAVKNTGHGRVLCPRQAGHELGQRRWKDYLRRAREH